MSIKRYRLPVNPGAGLSDDCRRPAGVDDVSGYEVVSDDGESMVADVDATDAEHKALQKLALPLT